MEIAYLIYDILPEQYHEDIKRLLVMADKEFFPPLSSRVSTTQNHFHDNASIHNEKDTILLYFKALLKQCFILAVDNDRVAGFLSFRKNHTYIDIDVLSENAYVSTICIDVEYRRHGIANCFYDKLETIKDIPFVYTRTWDQNYSHIYLLKKRNYELLYEIVDDRAPGINTVYYGKKIGV